MQVRLLPGFEATVDRVDHDPGLPVPPGQPHAFVYHITIRNGSGRVVTVLGRKWVVRSGSGRVTVVEGDGVVGRCPRLEPGESFSYNSYHTTDGPAVAEGAFLAETEEGNAVLAAIPPFEMTPPGKGLLPGEPRP
jgi:ApaG protein